MRGAAVRAGLPPRLSTTPPSFAATNPRHNPSHPRPRRLGVMTSRAVPLRPIVRGEVRPTIPPLDHMIEHQLVPRPTDRAPYAALPPHRLSLMRRAIRAPFGRLVEALRFLRQRRHPRRRAAHPPGQSLESHHRIGPRKFMGGEAAAFQDRHQGTGVTWQRSWAAARTHASKLLPCYPPQTVQRNHDIYGREKLDR